MDADHAAIITGGFTLGGVVITGVITWLVSLRAAGVSDARTLRDRRVGRLRDAFRPVLQTAMTLPDIARQTEYLLAGETEEQRTARLKEKVQDIARKAEQAQVELSLELGEEPLEILDLVKEVSDAYTTLMVARTHQRSSPGLTPLAQLDAMRDRLDQSVLRLGDRMRDVLHETERPLPRPRWRPSRPQSRRGPQGLKRDGGARGR